MGDTETEVEKTYANGFVAGPGRLGTTQLDEARTIKLFKADGGGYVIAGITVGQEERAIGLSDAAMFAVVTMYMYFVAGASIREWKVEVYETPPEA